MAGSLDKPTYTPQPPRTTDITQWAYREFQVLSLVLNKPPGWYLDPVTSAPTRPRDGLIAFADGTNWNPGAGAGFYVYYSGAWHTYLLTTGGTLTGTLAIAPPSGDADLILNKPSSGTSDNILACTNGVLRWAIVLGNSAAESGGNVGSDFSINRFSDAGAFIDVPISIIRSTGTVSINGAPLNMGAWTAYTPTLAAGAGTFTLASASGRYLRFGKTVFYAITINITTNGTAAGFITATLPVTPAAQFGIGVGREVSATGVALTGTIASGGSTIVIQKYDNTYPGGNGTIPIISGVYEV